MPKNKGKGGKNRKRGKNDAFEQRREIVYKNPKEPQEYAQVTKKLGGGWVMTKCFDGKERRSHIRGNMKKRVWIQPGDIVLVSLRDYQDDVADIIHKYYTGEAVHLVREKLIPDSVDLNFTGSGVVDYEDDDDFTIDFDTFGYMRDPDTYRRLRSTGVLRMDEEDVEYYDSLRDMGLADGPTH